MSIIRTVLIVLGLFGLGTLGYVGKPVHPTQYLMKELRKDYLDQSSHYKIFNILTENGKQKEITRWYNQYLSTEENKLVIQDVFNNSVQKISFLSVKIEPGEFFKSTKHYAVPTTVRQVHFNELNQEEKKIMNAKNVLFLFELNDKESFYTVQTHKEEIIIQHFLSIGEIAHYEKGTLPVCIERSHNSKKNCKVAIATENRTAHGLEMYNSIVTEKSLANLPAPQPWFQQKETFASFNRAIFLEGDDSSSFTQYRSLEMIVLPAKSTAHLILVSEQPIEIQVIPNDMKVLEKKELEFLRNYGIKGTQWLTKFFCYICDKFNDKIPGIMGLLAFLFFINILMIPSLIIEVQTNLKNKDIEAQRALLETKRIFDHASYESEIMKLQKQQMPGAAKTLAAALWELVLHYKTLITILPLSFSLRFKTFFWVQNLFEVEAFSIFNLYGLLNLISTQYLPGFMLNIGVIILIAAVLIWEEISKKNEEQPFVSYIMLGLLILVFVNRPVVQLISAIFLRLVRKGFIYIISKFLQKGNIHEISRQ